MIEGALRGRVLIAAALQVTLAQLIYEAQPYQRQIVLMREPVSRYYSAFHYYGCASKVLGS